MSGFRFPIYKFKFHHLPKASVAAPHLPPAGHGAGPTGGPGGVAISIDILPIAIATTPSPPPPEPAPVGSEHGVCIMYQPGGLGTIY